MAAVKHCNLKAGPHDVALCTRSELIFILVISYVMFWFTFGFKRSLHKKVHNSHMVSSTLMSQLGHVLRKVSHTILPSHLLGVLTGWISRYRNTEFSEYIISWTRLHQIWKFENLLDFIQIWHRVSSSHRRYAVGVQRQRSKVKVTA